MENTSSLTKLTNYINNLTSYGEENNDEISIFIMDTLLENNKLTEIDFSNCCVYDMHFNNLHKATNLKYIDFDGCKITEKSYSQIKNLINLEEIIINDKNFTDEMLKSFSTLNKLNILDLSCCDKLTYECIKYISKCCPLTKLILDYCNIDKKEIQLLKEEFPNINIQYNTHKYL